MSIENVAVIGGGLMGAGIAQVFATAGLNVTVFEPNADVRDSLRQRIADNLALMNADVAIADAVKPASELTDAVADADYVTEAAPEKLELKQSIFADLERHAPAHAILASNTSVIPITKITQNMSSGERAIGTHWWNPPHLIPLVEVIQTATTSSSTIEATMHMLAHVGKKPALVKKDVTGFVANRLQHALWREAIAMVADGICDAKTLDDCVKNSFGLRLPVLGPLENADLVGLDLTLDIHNTIIPALDRSDGPNPLLERYVEAGRLGFNSGEGFRSWTDAEISDLRTRLAKHLLNSLSK